jgi:hypothetical protein
MLYSDCSNKNLDAIGRKKQECTIAAVAVATLKHRLRPIFVINRYAKRVGYWQHVLLTESEGV